MSQRAYARHRGVAVLAVRKAIQAGRISAMPDGRIDPKTVDQEWARNSREYAPAAVGQGDDDGTTFGASQYTKARAVREHDQARLAKIEPFYIRY